MEHKPRIEPRTKVMIRARLRGAGPERDACIVDVSSRGLAATADSVPQRGDQVELIVGARKLDGQVKWSSMRRFGVAFRDRISVTSLLAGDGEAVTLRAREAVRKSREREASPARVLIRRIEFGVLVAVGAAATLIVADHVGSALQSLDAVRQTPPGEP